MRSLLATIAAAAVLVGGANVASYAATGKPLVLGKSNAAGSTTVLKNTGRGPALSLTSKRSAPSLAVSSRAKVTRLNADRVDGLEASALQTRAYRYHGYIQGGGTRFDVTLPLAVGAWLVTYDVDISNGGYQSPFECYVYETKNQNTQEVVGRERFITSLNYQLSLSGSGVLKRSDAASQVRLGCESNAGFDASFNVAATRVDKVLADKELSPIVN